MSRIGTIGTGTGEDIVCNCYYGTPHIVNGVCTCDNGVNGTIPPMPTSAPPFGFEWFWYGSPLGWKPKRINTVANNTVGQPFSFSKITDFIQQRPLITLGLAAGAVYLFTKK